MNPFCHKLSDRKFRAKSVDPDQIAKRQFDQDLLCLSLRHILDTITVSQMNLFKLLDKYATVLGFKII